MPTVTNPGTEYTNTMAITAMGAKAGGNPLHHDIYNNAAAIAAMGAKADGNPLHHDRTPEGASLTVTDVEVFNAAAPTSYTDLDLSGQVGSNYALVLLKVTTDGQKRIQVRKNGDTDDFEQGHLYAGGAAFAFGDSGKAVVFMVATDNSGVIEWKGETGTFVVDLIAFIK